MSAENVKVVRREGEEFEHMFKRFKKAYQESGVLFEVKRAMYYKSPSEKRREKRKQAERRRLKEMRKHGIEIPGKS